MKLTTRGVGGTEKRMGQLGVGEMGQMAKLCAGLCPGIQFSEAVQVDTPLTRRDLLLAVSTLVQNVGRGTVRDSYRMPNPAAPLGLPGTENIFNSPFLVLYFHSRWAMVIIFLGEREE